MPRRRYDGESKVPQLATGYMLTKKDMSIQTFVLEWVTKLNILPVSFDKATGRMGVKCSPTSLLFFHMWQKLLFVHAAFNFFRTVQSILVDGFIVDKTPMLVLWTLSYVVAHICTDFMFQEWPDVTVKLCNEFYIGAAYGQGPREPGTRRSPRELLVSYFPVMIFSLILSYPVAYGMLRDLPSLLISVIDSQNAIIVSVCLLLDMVTQFLALNIANFIVFFLLTFELNFLAEVEKAKALMLHVNSANMLTAAYAQIRKLQLLMALLNHCFSRVAFVCKLVCITAASFCAYAGVRLISLEEKPVLAFMYSVTSVMGIVAFIGTFGSVYELTKQVEKLKKLMIEVSASRRFENLDEIDKGLERRKQRECKMVVGSVPVLKVNSGGFRAIEREAAPAFAHCSLDETVNLLVTF